MLDQRGFTLIELVIVMILVAMISGIVIYSVKGHVDVAAVNATASELQSLDRQLRTESRRSERPITLRFNRGGKDVVVVSDNNVVAAGIKTKRSLPKHVKVDSVRVAPSNASLPGGDLTINSRGQSKNYVIQLTSNSGSKLWLVTLGLSGQQLRCKTEAEANALLRP